MRLRPYWFQALVWFVLLGAIALIVLTAFQAQAQEPKVADKKFIVATSLTLGSAAFDAWSTNRNLAHGYRELNPILGEHPSGGKVWALTMGEATGWSVAGYFVKRALPKRKVWMIFQAISFSGHLYGGLNNVRIYDPVKYPRVK